MKDGYRLVQEMRMGWKGEMDKGIDEYGWSAGLTTKAKEPLAAVKYVYLLLGAL